MEVTLYEHREEDKLTRQIDGSGQMRDMREFLHDFLADRGIYPLSEQKLLEVDA